MIVAVAVAIVLIMKRKKAKRLEAEEEGIDSYDQWGVELGKQLAKQITPAISKDDDALAAQDPSTQSLIKFYRANREF